MNEPTAVCRCYASNVLWRQYNMGRTDIRFETAISSRAFPRQRASGQQNDHDSEVWSNGSST